MKHGKNHREKPKVSKDVSNPNVNAKDLCKPFSLYLPGEDEKFLNPYHCYLRKNMIEIFSMTAVDRKYHASRRHMSLKTQGKYFAEVGRAAIRCRFCAHVPHQERTGCSMTLPKSLNDIYLAVSNNSRHHISNCPYIPEAMKKKVVELRIAREQTKRKGNRFYWEYSAIKLGLVNADNAIWHKRNYELVKKSTAPKMDTEHFQQLLTAYLEEPQQKNDVENDSKAKTKSRNQRRNGPDYVVANYTLPHTQHMSRSVKSKRVSVTVEYDSDIHSVDPEECVDVTDYF